MSNINYRQLLLSAPFGFAYHRIILDAEGKPVDYEFLEANVEFGRLTGLDIDSLPGRKITEVMPKIADEEFDWIGSYGQIAINGGERDLDQYSEHLGRWYKIHAYSNEKYFFATTCIDITEERNKTAELENFFNVNLDLLCIASVDGKFIKINKEWEHLLGYPVEELEKRTFLEFVHQDDITSTLEAMSKLCNNESVLQFTNRYRTSDGSYRFIEWRSSPHGNEIYAAARDVSQRVAHEQSIKENSEYINALLAAFPDTIFVVSSSGEIIDCRSNDPEMANLPTDTFVGKQYRYFLPDNINIKIDAVLEKIQSNNHPGSFECEMYCRDQLQHYECSIVPLGKDKYVAIVRNNTDKYNAAEALKNSVSQLSAAMDATADAILIVGTDMQIKKWNKKFEELWSVPEDILSNTNDGRFPDYIMLNTVAEQVKNKNAFLKIVEKIYASPECSQYDILELVDGRIIERYTQPQTIEGNIVGRVWSFRNITSFIEAERGLMLQKEQFELAVKGSNDGIWDWDVNSGVFYMSEKFKEQLGYTDAELSNTVESLNNHVHPLDTARVHQELENYLLRRSGPVCDMVFRMHHRDGSYRWIRSRCKAIWDADGAVIRVAGSHTDITEQRQLEAAVTLSEKNFRAFYEALEDMIFIVDLEGNIVDANPAALNKLAYTRKEIIGMPMAMLHDENKRDEATRMYQESLNGKRNKSNIPVRTKNNVLIPVETRISFGQWDSFSSMFVVSKDVREEEESLERFNVIFENNPALMTISNLKMEMFTVNKSFRKLTGYSNDEIIGKRPAQLSLFAETNIPNRAVAAIFSDKRVSNIEMNLRTKQGEIIPVLYSGSILHNKGQKYYLSVMVDITAQKAAEAAALKASHAKSEFLANMSHEIRTPLNGVIGFTELMKNTSMTAIQKQYIDNAYLSAHSLLSIINDILDLSKIEAGKIDLDIISADIIELAENAIDIIKLQATRKKLELLLNISPDVPRMADIDPQRLRQVLINLLSNAVKFTEQGEVELKLEFIPDKDGQGIFTFYVRDTGIGISEEQRPKLFRAFSQGDTSTTRKYGGTGLGLVISNLIAEKMGSNINLDSTYGEGSTFYFSFKTGYQGQAAQAFKTLPHIQRVLIVDDNTNNRLILSRTLSVWGVDSVCCGSGSEAIDLVGKHRFDVMIIDLQMPQMDGIETIKQLQSIYGRTYPLVVLLYSSADDESNRLNSTEIGIRYSLIKPVKSEDLYSFLNNIGEREPLPALMKSRINHFQDLVIDRNPYTILVAEDVPLNLVLVTAMIKQLLPNAEIVAAKNGQIAQDYLEKSAADLVFMDVQMPVLDGIEATKRIRADEQGTGFHVPIIALSAGALHEEKDKCLKAGMDDFLSKPIESKPLADVLIRYLIGNKEDMSDHKANTGSALSYDETALMLRLNNDKYMFDLLMKSAGSIYDSMISLSQAIKENDALSIEAEAHKIKGASLNLSFNKLAKTAKFIEDHSEAGYDLLQDQMEALFEEWQYLKKIVPALMD